jgi:hypothetical protein
MSYYINQSGAYYVNESGAYYVDDLNTAGDPEGGTVVAESASTQDENIVMSWPNHVISATLTSPDSWVSTLPLANLRDPVFSNIAKVSATTATINATFASFTQVGTLALANHNLSASATVRFYLYQDAAQTQLLYDSGDIRVWTRIYNTLDLLWQDENLWGGGPTAEDRAAYTTLFYAYANSNYGIKSIKIVINDPDNPDGFMTFGRLMLSRFFTPTYNCSYGIKRGLKSNTQLVECNGTQYARVKQQNRYVTFGLDYLLENEAFKKVYAAMRSQDIYKEILFSEGFTRNQYSIETSMIARFEQLNPLDQPHFSLFSNAINLIEIL